MSHCLRKCQAQVPIQTLIEPLFYSSSSYVNVYFPLLLVSHLSEVSPLEAMACAAAFHLLCVMRSLYFILLDEKKMHSFNM